MIDKNNIPHSANPDLKLKKKHIHSPKLVGIELEAALGINSELPESAYDRVARFIPDQGLGIDDYTQTVHIRRELLDEKYPKQSKENMFFYTSKKARLLNIKTVSGRTYQATVTVKNPYSCEHILSDNNLIECSIKVNLNKFMYGHNTNNIFNLTTLKEAILMFDTAIKDQYDLEISNNRKLGSIDINFNFLMNKNYNFISRFHKFCNYAKGGSSSYQSKKLKDHSISFKYSHYRIKMYDKGKELHDKQNHYLDIANDMQLIRIEVTIPQKVLRNSSGLNLDKSLDDLNQVDLNNLKRYTLSLLMKSYDRNIDKLVASEPQKMEDLGKDGFTFTCFEAMREWYILKKGDTNKAICSYQQHKSRIRKKYLETYMGLSAIAEYKKILHALGRKLAIQFDQPIKTRKKIKLKIKTK